MNKEKIKKYNKIARITGIIIALILVLGVSYAIFRTTTVGKKINSIITAKFDVVVENESAEAITIINGQPTSSIDGLKQNPYTFDIVNHGDIAANYKLYLQVPNTSTLPANKIKYSLEDTDTQVTISRCQYDNSGDNEDYIDDNINYLIANTSSLLLSRVESVIEKDQTLYEIDLGILGPNQKRSYALKIWISYASGIEVINKEFEAKVRVDAEQTNEDDAYLLEQIDVTNSSSASNLGLKTFVGLYSDGSVRYSGNGEIDYSKAKSLDVLKYYYDYDKLLNDVNYVLANNGYQTYNTYAEFYEYFNNPTDIDQNTLEVLNAMTSITSLNKDYLNLNFNGNIYFEEGILSIPNNLYYNVPINKIVISATVYSIGNNAFYGSGAKELYFEKVSDSYKLAVRDDITISSAFYGCDFQIIDLKYSKLTSIGQSMFSGQKNLETLTLPEKLITIGQNAFYDCNSLKDLTIPETVTTINASAFYNCTNLQSLYLPTSISTLGSSVFYNCTNLEELDLILPNLNSIPATAFYNCVSLKKLNISLKASSSKLIGLIMNSAFYNCNSLESLTMDATVKRIYQKSFYGCSSLKTATLPESITNIGDLSFAGGVNLDLEILALQENVSYSTGDNDSFLNVKSVTWVNG